MISNKAMGNAFENELCQTLGKAEFWVHRMAQSPAGQPADVIAAKNGRAYLIDCKNCVNSYFDKNRIEENQRASMILWEEMGNGSGWFAVKFSSGIYMVELWRLEDSVGVKLHLNWFESNAMSLYQWIVEAS